MVRRASALLLTVCCVLVIRVCPLIADTADEKPVLRWAADAEGGAPISSKTPKTSTACRLRGRYWPRLWTKKSAGRIEFVQYDFKSLVSGLQRGDFDFAMNGVEDHARPQQSAPTHPALLRLYPATGRPGQRRVAVRFVGRLQKGRRGGRHAGRYGRRAAVGPNGHPQAALRQPDRAVHRLGVGRLDAVLLDLPIAAYYAKPNRKAEVRRPEHRPRLLCHRLSQGPRSRWPRSSMRPSDRLTENGDAAQASTKSGTSGTSTRPNC